MKLRSTVIISCVVIFATLSFQAEAQKNSTGMMEATEGYLSFTVRTLSNSTGYSPKHVLSIWIKDASGNFVISRKVMAASRKKHLVKWVASSSYNTTTATTGATLNSHQMHTITWDGRDYNGNPVEDGIYQVWIEYTSQNSANGSPAGPSHAVMFHKGPVPEHLTPPNQPYFTEMVLDWIPLGVGLAEKPENRAVVSVSPNPFSDRTLLKIELKSTSRVMVNVLNSSGAEINRIADEVAPQGTYSCEWDGTDDNGTKLTRGVYLLQVIINGRSSVHKVLLH